MDSVHWKDTHHETCASACKVLYGETWSINTEHKHIHTHTHIHKQVPQTCSGVRPVWSPPFVELTLRVMDGG